MTGKPFRYNVSVNSMAKGEPHGTDYLDNMLFTNPVSVGDFLCVFLDKSYPSPEIPLTLGKVLGVKQFTAYKDRRPFTFVKILRDIADDR